MKVQVEAQPLHEPLAGGTPGASVARRAADRRPRRLPAGDDGQPRRPLRDAEAAAGAARAASRPTTVPVPAFLIRHPSAGAILVDTGLHPSIATDGQRELRRPRQPLRQADAGGRRRRAGAAARPRARPGRGPDRGHDPPAHRPHLGDLRVPELDLRRQRDRVGGGRARPAADPERLPPRPLRLRLRLPHGRLRPRRRSTPTPASAAPSTSSATARSASPSPPATAPATCR